MGVTEDSWKGIETHVYGTASELIDYFVNRAESQAIYRGLGCHNWTLTPSVARVEDNNPIRSLLEDSYAVFRERIYLEHYVNACDDAGIWVAGDSDELRRFLRQRQGVDFNKFTHLWPGDSDAVFNFLAQAQHHGVPTRLLDWTRSPLVACYFSISQALSYRKHLEVTDLKDWNVCIVELDGNKAAAFHESFEVRLAPGSTSKNLAAQKGMFTFMKGFEFNDLDLLEHGCSRVYLRRHVLPASELCDLSRIVERLGVTTATLFPSYEGAAKHSMERILLGDLHQEKIDGHFS